MARNTPKPGKYYIVNHKLKGKFSLLVKSVSGTFVVGLLRSVNAKLKAEGYIVGETIRIDATLAILKEGKLPVSKRNIPAKTNGSKVPLKKAGIKTRTKGAKKNG